MKNYNTKNDSTLSLDIYAYENLIEANLFNSTKEPSKQNDLVKKRKNAKQIIDGVISVIQNPFEFPRQKETEKPNTPEVVQYKATQKLLESNAITSKF
uniref:Uncharacterized protein n=1 Tax=Panagrolaimus sp. PS1159 TaxID=55785 RepID=A0AC35GH30_9BILA